MKQLGAIVTTLLVIGLFACSGGEGILATPTDRPAPTQEPTTTPPSTPNPATWLPTSEYPGTG